MRKGYKYYAPDGRPLVEVCENKKVYNKVYHLINDKNLSVEDALKHKDDLPERKSIAVLSSGETIPDFCKRLGLTTCAFYWLRKTKKLSNEECVKFYEDKYIYRNLKKSVEKVSSVQKLPSGESIPVFCKRIGLRRNSFYDMKKRKNISNEECFNYYVNKYVRRK